MITFIKYPIHEQFLQELKLERYCICDKIENVKDFYIVYPVTTLINNKIVYPKDNVINFYCKSLKKSDIIKFKGGFNIEKDTKENMFKQGRKWYFETNQKLPRKLKKKIIGTLGCLK